MESYIADKKNLYTAILEFLESSEDSSDDTPKNEFFERLTQIIKQQFKDGDSAWMNEFLRIIKSISDNHHRDPNFMRNTQELLQYYKDEIKQTMSNESIFHLFEDHKLLVHFLFKTDIITMTDTISSYMMNKFETNGNRYCHFFYPELEHFLGEEKMEDVKKELLNKNPNIFDTFELNRQEGENDSLICSMIRKDLVEEFIPYLTRNNYSLSSQITPSIFETNPFLISQKTITLIEYSAFFGSIQIFQYLKLNGVELTPSLWLHVIHSKNAELIHILETNKVCPPIFENKYEEELNNSNNNYLRCFIESIRCHHKDFSDYIENNLLFQEENNSKINELIVSNYIKCHNYSHFETESISNYGFFYLSLYNYNELFELLLKAKEKEIQKRIIELQIFQ